MISSTRCRRGSHDDEGLGLTLEPFGFLRGLGLAGVVTPVLEVFLWLGCSSPLWTGRHSWCFQGLGARRLDGFWWQWDVSWTVPSH